MMSKKLLAVGLGLLLIAGLSTTVSAQAPNVMGVSIIRADTTAYGILGIDSLIVVKVTRTAMAAGGTPDSILVCLLSGPDTLVADTVNVQGWTSGTINPSMPNGLVYGDSLVVDDRFYTWYYTLDPSQEADLRYFYAGARFQEGGVWGNPGTSSMGIRMDGTRDVSSQMITGVEIEEGLTTDDTLKIGSSFTARVALTTEALNKFAYPTDSLASKLEKVVVYMSPKGVDTGVGVRGEVVADGTEDTVDVTVVIPDGGFQDLTEVQAYAFVQDLAGNLSGSTVSLNPHGRGSTNTWWADGTKPSITINHPAEGGYFNNYYHVSAPDNDDIADSSFTYALSEDCEWVKITWSGSSFDTTFHRGDPYAAAGTYNLVPAGLAEGTYDVTIEAEDWAGNTNSATVKNVTYDKTDVKFDKLFPQSTAVAGDAGIDTLNYDLAKVMFALSEEADSVAITYTKVGTVGGAAGDPEPEHTYVLADSERTLVGTVQTFTVIPDTVDSTIYQLTLYARDHAGNVTEYDAGQFVYLRSFVEPVIAQFEVEVNSTNSSGPDATPATGDTVLAGESITLTITAKASDGRRAVTYATGGVLVKAEGATGVTWSGTGVTDLGGGVASLDEDGWVGGQRTVTITDTVAESFTVTVLDTLTTPGTSYTGSIDLTWLPAMFTQYEVVAPDTVYVDSSFAVNVRPMDRYGNTSLLYSVGPSTYNEYQFVWVAFSANKPGTTLPLGPQKVLKAANEFTVFAPSVATTNLIISVRTTDQAGTMIGVEEGTSDPIVVTTPPVPPVAELDAPDSVWVEPLGGQGTFVRVSWILSDDNPGLGGNDKAVEYAIAAYDLDGNLKYQAVVPALYFPTNVPPTNIGTVVFYTWEDTDSLRYYVWAQNRGIPLASAAYSVPKKAYKKLADGSVLVIPEKVAGAAKSTPVMRSAAAVSEPVAAYDGVPPAPVAWVRAVDTPADEGGKITVSWTASPDDKMFEVWGYPVRGVTGYRIYRKALGEEEFQLAGTAPAGATTFVDEVGVNNQTYIYKVFAADASNEVASEVEEQAFAAANVGVPVGDFTSDGMVGFDDFFAFVTAFGTTSEQVEFDPLFDLTSDDKVDFEDFFAFVEHFGETTGAAKQVPVVLGINTAARLLTQVKEDGSDLVIDAAVEGAVEAKGCGFVLKYDPRAYEFVRAEASTDLPMLVKDEGGELAFAYAVGKPTSEALKVRFYFRPKDELGGAINVLRAVVADPFNRLNPVEVLRQTIVAPKAFALGQNRPNPFNPTTVIEYVLPESAPVKLEVYNLLGQVVRTLVDEEQMAGRYSVVWDGRDDLGREVASGIYFYRLSAGKFHAVRRMALVR